MWTPELIRALADEDGEMLASIYFPTHTAGPEIQQDPIRLKNALQALEQECEARGLDRTLFGKLAEHPRKLLDAQTFWRYQSNGLALFCRPDGMRTLKLPFSPVEFRRLGTRFHIAPLIRAAGDVQVFHLLAVNREGSVLYDVAGDEIAERPLDPMLESLDAARGMSDFDAYAGFHTDHRGQGRQGQGDEGAPRYHALGTGSDEQEEIELERYLASISKAVGEALVESDAPLVLAGGDRITGHLRPMLKVRRLCDGQVSRNALSAPVEVLADEARGIVADETTSPRDEAFELLEARLASGEETASADYQKLSQAAGEGRVEAIFLDLGGKSVGSETDDSKQTMIDALAADTLRHGGRVYALPDRAGDEITPAAGLFRY